MTPDWDDLRLFLAVARAGSLSAAGRALRLDPATVGRRVARLEAALAARLFTRSPAGYVATPAGRRLFETALRAEAALAEVPGAVRGDGAGLSGQVRIGAPDGCANFLLPQVVARLVAANPGLEVEIVALPRIFDLSRREADLAIAVSKPRGGRLIATRIAPYRLSLAAHADYLAAHPPITAPGDLAGHRIIGYIPDMIFDAELDYLAEIGVGRPALASNSVAVQLQLIRAGAGIGIVHDFALPSAPGVVRVLPDRVRLERAFWLLRHADDRGAAGPGRLARPLAEGLRAELARLESLA
jgi:DNA-binding transcriptional LysR family regulator